MKARLFLARLCLLLSLAQVTLADGAPELLRLLILDKSGSMAGARIEQLKRTVREWIQSYPPSPEAPFAIIPFDRRAGAARTFTDKQSVEEFLDDLDAGGSTSIASGLHAGADFLRNYLDASNLIILLVTDGEDTVDPQSVPAAEARLDAIFAKRDPDRLPTSVFVQRWDNVNDALVRRWLGKTNVRVYDLGSKKPLTLTVSPRVGLERVAWSPDTTRRLEAHVTVAIDVQGAFPPSEPLDTQVDATAAGAVIVSAKTNVIHRGGGTITLELVPTGEPSAVGITLQFSLLTREASGGPILATIIRPALTMQMQVPRIPVRITSQLEAHDSRWAPSGAIAADASLHVSAALANPGPWTSALELDADFGTARLLGGASVIRFQGQGSVTETYAIELSPVVGTKPLIAAKLVPRTLPWPLQLDPTSELSASAVVRTPALSRVALSAAIRISRGPLWTDLAAGRAAFQADLEVTANAAADGIALVAENPALAASASRPSAILREGRASIPVRLEAVMHPNELVPFEIRITPSAGIPPGMTIESVTAHCEIQAPPPASLRLALAFPGSGRPPTLALESTPWSGEYLVTPTVSGAVEEEAAAGLRLRVSEPASAAGTELMVGHTTTITLAISETPQPALDDRFLSIDVRAVLATDLECVRLDPSEIQVTLLAAHRQALLIGAAALTLLVVVGLGLRIHAQSSSPTERAPLETT